MKYFEDKSYWLNEHGLVVLQFKKQPNLFAIRDYHWVNSITITDESDGRHHLSSFPIEIFTKNKEEDFIPILPEEAKLIKRNRIALYCLIEVYSEIKQIRRELKLNKIL